MIYRTLSVIACAYLMIVVLGYTASYVSAFEAGFIFNCVWLLGYYSRLRGQK